MPTTVIHGRSRLALHDLRDEPAGRPLLLLHGLGESTPRQVPAHLRSWPGPVLGLDFTGHGRSTRPVGGGYTAEVLLADTDAALARTGPVTLLGRGLGAYVALLAAGAHPDLVRGVVLADGPGLAGGGGKPASPFVLSLPSEPTAPTEPAGDDDGPDPFALFELSHDIRPPDYAVEYLRLLTTGSDLARPLAVCTVVRPDWLTAVIAAGADRVADILLADALAQYAAVA